MYNNIIYLIIYTPFTNNSAVSYFLKIFRKDNTNIQKYIIFF